MLDGAPPSDPQVATRQIVWYDLINNNHLRGTPHAFVHPRSALRPTRRGRSLPHRRTPVRRRHRRFDVVAPARSLRCKGPGHLLLDLGTPQITDQGVTDSIVEARYTRTAWRQVADRLHIPLQYLDRLVEMENPIGPMLACHTINDLAMADDRRALYRFVRTTDGGYVLRAVLSDKYRAIDNDTALQAIIGGLTDNGPRPR